MSAHPGLGARLQKRGGRGHLPQLPEQLTLLTTEEGSDLIDGRWTDSSSITKLCVTSSSSRFRETKLIRDGGSGKLLLQCCASGARRHAWVVYNAKGHEVLHVQLNRPSWWQRLRRGDAGPCPYELVATEPHFPHPCIVGRAEQGRLVLRAHTKVKGQEGAAMAEAEMFRATFPATLGSSGGSAQAGAAAPVASGSSGSSQGSLPRGSAPGALDSPRSPAAGGSAPATPRSPAAGGGAPVTPRSLRRASISSTGSTAAAAAMAAGPSPGAVFEVGCHLAVAPRAETPLMVALCTIYKAALDRRAVDAVREIKAAAAKVAAKAAKAAQRTERAQQAASAAAGKAGAAGVPAGSAGGSSSGPPSPTSSRSGSVTAGSGGSPPPTLSVPSPLRSPSARSPTLSSVGEIEEEPEDSPPVQRGQRLRQQYALQPVAA